jgi:hypothetical protein
MTKARFFRRISPRLAKRLWEMTVSIFCWCDDNLWLVKAKSSLAVHRDFPYVESRKQGDRAVFGEMFQSFLMRKRTIKQKL